MKFIVSRYYSGFCTNTIEAENESEAIEKARKLPVDEDEILCSLEDWKDADDVEIVKDN